MGRNHSDGGHQPSVACIISNGVHQRSPQPPAVPLGGDELCEDQRREIHHQDAVDVPLLLEYGETLLDRRATTGDRAFNRCPRARIDGAIRPAVPCTWIWRPEASWSWTT